jgi:hypothetical protein
MFYVLLYLGIVSIISIAIIFILMYKSEKEFNKSDDSYYEYIVEKKREEKLISNEIKKLNRHLSNKKDKKQTLYFPKIDIKDD